MERPIRLAGVDRRRLYTHWAEQKGVTMSDDLETAFLRWVNQFGGLSTKSIDHLGSQPSQYLQDFLSGCAVDLRTGTRQGRPMRLRVGITNDQTFNAYADNDGPYDFIGIAHGVFHQLTMIFRAALSHPIVFPFVGHVGQAPGFVADLDWICCDMLDEDRTPPPVTDRRRKALWFLLMNIGVEFLLRHEFAHVWNGHAEWCQREYKRMIDEKGRAATPQFDPIDIQTIEYDADKSASINTLALFLGAHQFDRVDGTRRWHIPEAFPTGTIEARLEAIAFATYMCHRLITGPIQGSLEDLLKAEYPPGAVRLATTANIFASRLQDRVDLPEYRWRPPILKGFRSAEEAWCIVTRDQPINVLSTEIQQLGEDLKFRLRERWADKLFAELDRLKRGGQLAPPEPEKIGRT